MLRAWLVEDGTVEAALVRRQLQDTAEVQVFTELAQALAALGSDMPDVLVLDLDLPDSQGLETLRRVMDAHPEAPVLVMTGHDDPEMAAACLDSGALDHVVKGTMTEGGLAHVLRRVAARGRRDSARAVYAPMDPVLRHLLRSGRATLDGLAEGVDMHRQKVWRRMKHLQAGPIKGYSARVPEPPEGWSRYVAILRDMPLRVVQAMMVQLDALPADAGVEFIVAHHGERRSFVEVLAQGRKAIDDVMENWMAPDEWLEERCEWVEIDSTLHSSPL